MASRASPKTDKDVAEMLNGISIADDGQRRASSVFGHSPPIPGGMSARQHISAIGGGAGHGHDGRLPSYDAVGSYASSSHTGKRKRFSLASEPRGTFSLRQYKKKEPLFARSHSGRVRSTTGQKIKSLIQGLKTTMTNRFKVGGQLIDETLQYRVKIAHAMNDDRTDEQIKLSHLLTIVKNSEDRVKRVLRPSRRALKEQERLAKEQKERERRIRGILGRQPLPAALDDEQEDEVDRALHKMGKIAQIPGAAVEAHDIVKLAPAQWLNDEVINFYIKLIERRNATAIEKRAEAKDAQARLSANAYGADEDGKRLQHLAIVSEGKKRWNAVWNVHVFNSFFYEKLSKQGYAGVRQWTRKVDIFTKDLVLFPVNVGQMHWVCAAINFRLLRFEYYDSMHARPDRTLFDRLEEYVQSEYADKKKDEFGELDLSGWTRYISYRSPTQTNGYDCGVFATMTMEQLSRRDPWLGPMPAPLDAKTVVERSAQKARDLSPDYHSSANQINGTYSNKDSASEEDEEDEYWNFSQSNMPYLRRRMVYEIATKTLMD